MQRFNEIIAKSNSREIVLLKGKPCIWGKCAFCDYIFDNNIDEEQNFEFNKNILKNVTGKFSALEVINSGSVFELDKNTLLEIKKIAKSKNISKLFFECYYSYKDRLNEIRNFFDGIEIIFKCGIETFDNNFRNKTLKKGIVFNSIQEVKKYFNSVCIMVGILGQTKEMIENDIEILTNNFEYGCINVYCNNSTAIKQDDELIKWFKNKYQDWHKFPKIDVLFNNTDFGVGCDNIQDGVTK